MRQYVDKISWTNLQKCPSKHTDSSFSRTKLSMFFFKVYNLRSNSIAKQKNISEKKIQKAGKH